MPTLLSANSAEATPSRNLRKHTSRNPLEQALLRRFHRVLVTMAEQAIGPEASPLVFEMGCGEGFVLRALQERWPRARLYGLDFSAPSLDWAHGQTTAALVCGDAHKLPVASNAFPFVIAAEVLEHLAYPQIALEEIARIANPFVLLTVPHQPWFSAANFLRGKNWSHWGDDPEHLSHWTPTQFLALIGQRLELRSVRYSFPWLLALSESKQ